MADQRSPLGEIVHPPGLVQLLVSVRQSQLVAQTDLTLKETEERLSPHLPKTVNTEGNKEINKQMEEKLIWA